MSAKTVFISYSHDSDDHRKRVLGLSERLRNDGIETLLDQYVNGSPLQGWPRWMLDQLDRADSVLVVCTETYYRRFRGHEDPGKGKGVDFEGALITQEIYDARSRTLKFIPVLFSVEHEGFIPEPLRGGTHYTLTSASSYKSLYDFMLGQAGVEPSEVGALKTRARPKGTPLIFADESPSVLAHVDISRIIKYAPAELIGREAETKLLSDAWDKAVRGEAKRPHVLTFVALGGEGKTSLVAKWVADLAYRDWPGCDAAFAWSFYSQGTRDQPAVSSDSFLAEALTFFGDPAMASSPASTFDKGRRLAQLVGEQRALLILDGLEPLQYAPSSPTPGELKDVGIAALLKGLAAINRGLCVVTTRYAIPDLRAYWQTTAPMQDLPRLSTAAGVALLKRIGVKTGSQSDFEKLVEDVDGHALTLQIIGQFLMRAFYGDIRRRDRVDFIKANVKIHGGHAFRAMEAYVKWMEDDSEESRRELALLKLLGLFDRPATSDCVNSLRRAPVIPGLTEPLMGLSDEDWEFSLTSLRDAKLLTVSGEQGSRDLAALDAHPLLREYFAQHVRQKEPDAWRAAHRRLYEYLSANTDDKDQPSLEDLQPLYQAVAHGCHADLHQEAFLKVYIARILRGDKYYSSKKLGALSSDLGAVACFFQKPWSRLAPSFTRVLQSWLLNQAAIRLQALGRLIEAVEPLRVSCEMDVTMEDWGGASISYSNLSELELTLGSVAAGVADAEQSVSFADHATENVLQQVSARVRLADACLSAGRLVEAHDVFSKAKTEIARLDGSYQWLPGNWGFRHDKTMLAEAERVAWGATLGRLIHQNPSGFLSMLNSVAKRGSQRIEADIISEQPLLDIALDHLILGRAALYAAILGKAERSLDVSSSDARQRVLSDDELFSARLELDAAVSGLRRAGTLHHLPRGLLSRAWLQSLTATNTRSESAQTDLDEAWEIAERGPMRLYMADIHLYRARLFHAVQPYPWTSPHEDLAAARKLIEQCGYWRRKEELEDAEAAAKNW